MIRDLRQPLRFFLRYYYFIHVVVVVVVLCTSDATEGDTTALMKMTDVQGEQYITTMLVFHKYYKWVRYG
jgi:hypothetical protein